MIALGALVAIRVKLGDPLFDPGSGELQVDQQSSTLLGLFNSFPMTPWACAALDFYDFVRASVRVLKPSMALVDVAQWTVGSHEDLFTLVIKVGALIDMLEVLKRVFLFPKQFPTWALLIHVVSANGTW